MGYLLRGLRIASYLAAALGLLLIFGTIINDVLLFYGVRFLFMGVAGIGATSLLRDRYLEGTEEEQYQSLGTAVELPLSNWARIKKTILNLDGLVGSISGLIGVVVGSFAAGVVLNMQATEAGYEGGWEYLFGALLCFGYPLIGALLGAIIGALVLIYFRRFPVVVSYPKRVMLFVGFVIGLLVGIAPFIGIQWLDKIYWQ